MVDLHSYLLSESTYLRWQLMPHPFSDLGFHGVATHFSITSHSPKICCMAQLPSLALLCSSFWNLSSYLCAWGYSLLSFRNSANSTCLDALSPQCSLHGLHVDVHLRHNTGSSPTSVSASASLLRGFLMDRYYDRFPCIFLLRLECGNFWVSSKLTCFISGLEAVTWP